MNIKQKSTFILVGLGVFLVSVLSLIIYQIMTVEFQQIENERVERNILRVDFIIKDRVKQFNSKLADWTIWDDTYEFMNDGNQRYIESNLSQESFEESNIDKALFIDKNGALIASFILEKWQKEETDFPQSFYKYFATESALLKVDMNTKFNGGIIGTDGGLLMFVIREVFMSNGEGEANGYVVFGRYIDNKTMESMKGLTQFETKMYAWNDLEMSEDFLRIKEAYFEDGSKSLVAVLNEGTISGYQIVEDVFGKPVAIIRSDIERDISLHGKEGRNILIGGVVFVLLIVAILIYLLLFKFILEKILNVESEIDKLSKSGLSSRLKISNTNDEIDKLRLEINKMLDSLEKNKTELSSKESFIEKIMDNLIIGIAVNRISNGKAIYMNRAFESIYGWSKEKLTSIDTFFLNVYPNSKVREPLKKRVLADIASGDMERMKWDNLEITRSDGNKRFINAQNIPFIDQDLMVSTVVDVTEMKLDSDKRERYTKELEKINNIMIGRELKMMELKNEIKKLEVKKNNK